MKYLLDTHTFLWFSQDAPALSGTAKSIIEDPTSTCLCSIASCWEIAIKTSIGKLRLGFTLPELFTASFVTGLLQILPITTDHIIQVASLPFHHKDPFDRIIAAQAQIEKLPIISTDTVLDLYGIQRIW